MRNLLLCGGAVLLFCISCQKSTNESTLNGTYLLIEGTTIKGTDTVYVKADSSKTEMIKIFNNRNFAFFNHDVSKGVDSTALFVSGAGTYTLDGGKYIENLEYCSFRPWEGKQFEFTMEVKGDTLIQQGVEDIPELGVKQYIIEKYLRLK